MTVIHLGCYIMTDIIIREQAIKTVITGVRSDKESINSGIWI